MAMHGTLEYVEGVVAGHIERIGIYKERRGWKGHAAKELRKRRRANKIARASRKENRQR